MRICELCVQTRFDIVDNIALDLLLGTSLPDHYIRVILPGEHRLVSWHSTVVAMIKSYDASVLPLEESNRQEGSELVMSEPVCVSKRVLVAILRRSSRNQSRQILSC